MTAYYNELDRVAAECLRRMISAGLIAPGDVDERDIGDVGPDEVMGYDQCHWFAGIGCWMILPVGLAKVISSMADTTYAKGCTGLLSGWATPAARDYRSESASVEYDEARMAHPRGKPLSREATLAAWPTPNATDWTGPGTQGRDGGANLQTAVTLTGPVRITHDGRIGSTAAMENGGRLNPDHSRWLMRLPAELGRCVPTETASTFQRLDARRRQSTPRASTITAKLNTKTA